MLPRFLSWPIRIARFTSSKIFCSVSCQWVKVISYQSLSLTCVGLLIWHLINPTCRIWISFYYLVLISRMFFSVANFLIRNCNFRKEKQVSFHLFRLSHQFRFSQTFKFSRLDHPWHTVSRNSLEGVWRIVQLCSSRWFLITNLTVVNS